MLYGMLNKDEEKRWSFKKVVSRLLKNEEKLEAQEYKFLSDPMPKQEKQLSCI